MSDERLKRPADPARQDRAMHDRAVTEDRELNDQERRSMLRTQVLNQVLPDPPKLPGFQLVWLSTTNQQDSIQGRIRLGYQPVKPEELPGFETNTLKSGEWTGFIGINEMLLFKLPTPLWLDYMTELHHEAPLEEEGKIAEQVIRLKEQLQKSGSKVQLGDGYDTLGKAKRPIFDH